MRVISGKRRGAKLLSLDSNLTRPTLSRVKEAVFSSISPYISGNALDLFAGSGALGIEAISRGCEQCHFVDINDEAINIIQKNIKKLKFEDQAKILKKDAQSFLKSLPKDHLFSLIFLDPPYENTYLNTIIEMCASHLTEDGIIVVECQKDYPIVVPQGIEIIKDKQYGISRVVIIKGV